VRPVLGTENINFITKISLSSGYFILRSEISNSEMKGRLKVILCSFIIQDSLNE